MEIWLPVPGYENLYKASSLGRIYSFDRTIPIKGGSIIRKAKYLIPCNRVGYSAITLVDIFGKRKQKLIHRLVAEMFIPNPENKPQINHVNGNKKDNTVQNLEWATREENMTHAYKTGLHTIPDNTGRFNQGSSCRVQQLDIHGRLIKEWPSMKEVSRTLGYSDSGICQACSGKIKSYKGFQWKYITNPRRGMGNYKLANPRIDAEIEKLYG